LAKRASELNNFIALCTEPNWYTNKNTKQRKIMSTVGTTLTGPVNSRASIVVDNNINAWLVDEFTGYDITTIFIQAKDEKFYITSVYMEYQEMEILPKLIKLIEHCRKINAKLLIGTDSNAHSSLWSNNADTNPRGVMVENLIFQHDLYIHNTGVVPTFVKGDKKSFIDLTLSNRDMEEHITKWKVDTSESHSDHRYLLYQISFEPSEKQIKRNLTKCNWVFLGNLLIKD
jgi:hypothetical protein